MSVATRGSGPGLAELHRRIRRQIDRGRTPDEVEAQHARTASSKLDEEQRAALWLYAWSYAELGPVPAGRGDGLPPLD